MLLNYTRKVLMGRGRRVLVVGRGVRVESGRVRWFNISTGELQQQLPPSTSPPSSGTKLDSPPEESKEEKEENISGWSESSTRFTSLSQLKFPPYPEFKDKLVDAEEQETTTLSLETGYSFETLQRRRRKGEGKVQEEESDSDKVRQLRFNGLKELKEFGEKLQPGERVKEWTMVVAGRILARRDASAKLIFYDLQLDHQKLQLVANKANFTTNTSTDTTELPLSFADAHRPFRRGDILRVRGFVGKTKAGELSLFVLGKPELLSPCLTTLPLQLESTELLLRRRVLTLMLHSPTYQAIYLRANLLKTLRRYLDDRGFIEVETPILASQAGGAAARSFFTVCHALDGLPLHLRISPELYLKQMVIGGFDRIYEIGRVFRNESIDPTHNPEFTTCEFYLAYANLETLFNLTQDLLRNLVQTTTGKLQISLPSSSSSESTELTEIDFQPPFRRINVVEELTRILGEPLPDYDGPVEAYLDLCERHHLPLTPPHTIPRILDQLIGHYIEPQCHQPTFLTGHPTVMSPLARGNPDRTAARFELFINRLEFVNAYEELNIPHEQLARFQSQASNQHGHAVDPEAHPVDLAYCHSLTYGLPPTAGWGLGIDRLIGLITGAPNLRTTLAFPLTRPR